MKLNLSRLKYLAGLTESYDDDEDPDAKIAASDKRQQEFEKKNKSELKKGQAAAKGAEQKKEAPKKEEKKPAAEQKKEAPPAAEKKKGQRDTSGSKQARARAWLSSHGVGASRSAFINWAASNLQMSKHHANTFFYANKKKVTEFYVIKNKKGLVLDAFSAYDAPCWVVYESEHDRDALTIIDRNKAEQIVETLRKKGHYGIVVERCSMEDEEVCKKCECDPCECKDDTVSEGKKVKVGSVKFGKKMAKTSKQFKKTRANMKTLKESDYGAPKSSTTSGTDTGASAFKGDAPAAKEINYGDTNHKDAKKIDFGKVNKDGEFTKEKENNGDSIPQTNSMFSGKGKATAGTKPSSTGGVASTPDNKSEKTESKPVWKNEEKKERPTTDVAKSHENESGEDNKVETPSNIKSSLSSKKAEMEEESKKQKGRNPDGNAFYESVVDAMTRLERMINNGTVKQFKEAQLFMNGLMGPILWLIPEDVRHFINTGGRKQSLMDMYKEVKIASNFGGQ